MSPIDLPRLARAVHLDASRRGRDLWVVSGGRVPHRVDRDPTGMTCDCVDATVGRRVCKHVLAVRLSLGEATVLRALRDLVPLPRSDRGSGGRTKGRAAE